MRRRSPDSASACEATLAAFSSRVAVTYSNEPTLPEMLAALKTLPADSLILYVRYSPVTKGRVIFPDELLPGNCRGRAGADLQRASRRTSGRAWSAA